MNEHKLGLMKLEQSGLANLKRQKKVMITALKFKIHV